MKRICYYRQQIENIKSNPDVVLPLKIVMSSVDGGGDDIKGPWKTHDEEEFCHRHQLESEQFIDGTLSQSSHLPPVREEGGTGADEADNVDDYDEDDDQVEVEKLWSCMKRNFWIIL